MGRRRRLSSGFGVPVLSAPPTPTSATAADALQHSAALGRNDDAAELQAAQLQYARQQQQLGLRTTPLSPAPAPAPATPSTARRRSRTAALHRRKSLVNENAEGRRLMYENCIKLSAANKISQKNTWQLGLIDYMEDVIDDGNETNFTKASCTIDASVKIYSHRVDSVHQDMFRVLGGLHQRPDGQDASHADHESGDDNDDDEGDDDGEKRAARKRSRRGAATLEKNPDNLLVRKEDLVVEVDPMFHKTSSAFDEGGAHGLLLNQLGVGSGCRIVFDSTTSWNDVCAHGNGAELELDVSSISRRWRTLVAGGVMLPLCPLGDDLRALCSQASATAAPGWNPSSSSPPPPPLQTRAGDSDSDDGFDVDEGLHDELDAAVDLGPDADAEEQGDTLFGVADADELALANRQEQLLQSELRHGADDAFGAHELLALASDAIGGGVGAEPHRRVSFNARLLLASPDDEYAFLDADRVRNWAGLSGTSHWKFASKTSAVAVGAAPDGAGDQASKTKKPSRTASFLIDFDADPIDRAEAFPKPKRSDNTLTDASIKKALLTSYVLPPDLHMKTSWLRRLFTRPRLLLRFDRPSPSASGIDCEQLPRRWFDYDNDNDTSNYVSEFDDCAQEPVFGDDDDDDDVTGDGFGDAFADTIGASSLDLVDRPEMAAKQSITFATTAKKVDVKVVKQNIWSHLSELISTAPLLSISELGNGDFVPDDVTSSASGGGGGEEKVEEESAEGESEQRRWPSFQETISVVQESLPESTRQNTSVPFYFVCLLHLANENALLLKPGANLGDFQIARSLPVSSSGSSSRPA